MSNKTNLQFVQVHLTRRSRKTIWQIDMLQTTFVKVGIQVYYAPYVEGQTFSIVGRSQTYGN